MTDVDLEFYEGLLREIGDIVRVPTSETRHRTARDHFQSDFYAIRRIVSVGLASSRKTHETP